MSTIAERVAAGAAFLDEYDPDWWRADVDRAIDLDELVMSDGKRCILGQRCPLEVIRDMQLGETPYGAWTRTLGELLGFWPLSTAHWAERHGFDDADSDKCNALAAEWRRVITERRSRA